MRYSVEESTIVNFNQKLTSTISYYSLRHFRQGVVAQKTVDNRRGESQRRNWLATTSTKLYLWAAWKTSPLQLHRLILSTTANAKGQ